MLGKINHSSEVGHLAYGQLAHSNFQLGGSQQLANPPNHIHTRSVDSLLHHNIISLRHWWFMVVPLIHPHTHIEIMLFRHIVGGSQSYH